MKRKKAPNWVTQKPTQRSRGPQAKHRTKLKMRSIAGIKTKKIEWLWRPYVPMGMLTLLSGDPSMGKSTITCDIAARVTRGDPMPLDLGRRIRPRNVMMISGEDPVETVLVPKLINLRAARSRMSIPEEKAVFTLDQEGCSDLESQILEGSFELVIIDPLSQYLGAKVDMNKANEVRAVMWRLADIANRTNTAIVCVRHLRKAGGGNLLYRGAGSIDFTASVRSEIMVEKSKTGDKWLRHIKCNLDAQGKALRYELKGWKSDQACIEWIEKNEHPDAAVSRTPRALEKGRDLLFDLLRDGGQEVKTIREAGEAVGISYRTLERAKRELGVQSTKTPAGPWIWHLAERED